MQLTVCKKSPHYFFSAFVSARSINSEGGFKQSTVALIYLICKVHFKMMTFYLSYLKHKESAQIILTDKTEGPELGLAMRLHQNDAHIRKRCGCVWIENVKPHWTTYLVIRVPTPFESQIWVNLTRFFSDACFYCGVFTWKCQNNWNIAMHWCPISLLLLSLSHSCQPTINEPRPLER